MEFKIIQIEKTVKSLGWELVSLSKAGVSVQSTTRYAPFTLPGSSFTGLSFPPEVSLRLSSDDVSNDCETHISQP